MAATKEAPLCPPEETLWQQYSPHFELPLAGVDQSTRARRKRTFSQIGADGGSVEIPERPNLGASTLRVPEKDNDPRLCRDHER